MPENRQLFLLTFFLTCYKGLCLITFEELSFYDYINQYRVNEANPLLNDPEYSNQEIASIVYDTGFNSLSAFNEVFKKVAGTTPSQFRKDEQQVSRQQRG